MNRGLVKISKEELLEIYGDSGNVMRTYIDPNFLVRWLYWHRLSRLLTIGGRYPGRTVLDIGCGQGVFLPSLAKRFETVLGVDLNIQMAERIKEKYGLDNVTLKQTDILKDQLPENNFDCVSAVSVLEHFEDLDLVLGKIKSLLKPGGVLMISSPTESAFYQLGRKVFKYDKDDELTQHHTDVAEIEEFMRKYFRVVYKENGPKCSPSPLSAYKIVVGKKETNN